MAGEERQAWRVAVTRRRFNWSPPMLGRAAARSPLDDGHEVVLDLVPALPGRVRGINQRMV